MITLRRVEGFQMPRERLARLHSFSHPTLRTPTDEELAIDVAWIGDRRARRAIFVTSELHGFGRTCRLGNSVDLA